MKPKPLTKSFTVHVPDGLGGVIERVAIKVPIRIDENGVKIITPEGLALIDKVKARRAARWEVANCIICKTPMVRLRGRGKKYCEAEKCQKIKKLSNSVANFSKVPHRGGNFQSQQQAYHGGYSE